MINNSYWALVRTDIRLDRVQYLNHRSVNNRKALFSAYSKRIALVHAKLKLLKSRTKPSNQIKKQPRNRTANQSFQEPTAPYRIVIRSDEDRQLVDIVNHIAPPGGPLPLRKDQISVPFERLGQEKGFSSGDLEIDGEVGVDGESPIAVAEELGEGPEIDELVVGGGARGAKMRNPAVGRRQEEGGSE
ncbi:hypothetical protein B296_00011949 [Ensete ventricosum]|uniref:Uncharacterized protein n=1 Tax=Ensete ventricosum TaxID=4639 RepID=A0A427AAA3_ENSVE|nr:hypothetical protein B296_00011949 [Ensete ventricosum]